MRYTISEMATLLGVTTHTLRYYEKMGLIQPGEPGDRLPLLYGHRHPAVQPVPGSCGPRQATLEECKDFLDEPSTAVTLPCSTGRSGSWSAGRCSTG